MKILLLEDERMLRTTVAEYLRELGHKVEEFADGETARRSLLSEPYDLLLLDINVPKLDGFALLEAIRDQKIYTPVIFVSALVEIEEITKGFTLGCADYIKKPFHLKELQLRLDNFRRLARMQEENHVLLGKHYAFDKESDTLFFQGEPQELTRRRKRIIALLAERIGTVVDYDTFREYAWEGEPVDDPSIRAEMGRLRKSLKEDFILNVRGLGYQIRRVCKVDI